MREEGGFRRSIVPLLETVYFYDARPTEHAGEGVPTKRESQRLTVWGPAASPSEAVSARIRCSGASLVVPLASPLPACTIQTGGSRPRCAQASKEPAEQASPARTRGQHYDCVIVRATVRKTDSEDKSESAC